jgi:hypothetical protein
MLRTLTILAMLSSMFAHDVVASTPDYFEGERVKKTSRPVTYTSAMHHKFANAEEYERGGAFYYRDGINSFGMREAINTEQEVIFCSGSEQSFSDAMARAASIPPAASHVVSSTWSKGADVNFAVQHDSTSMSFPPAAMDDAIITSLTFNATSNAKGRFCYDIASPDVDYREAGAKDAVYCPADTSPIEITDPGTGETCRLELDVDLKVGETRFLRQLQGGDARTVSQGFVGCYQGADRNPTLQLVANPTSCTKESRDSCSYSCEWAHEVVCNPVDMPRWGGGKCGGLGTVIFKDDVIEVNAHPNHSYDQTKGVLYEGKATMSCRMVTGKAQWVVANNSCSKKEG